MGDKEKSDDYSKRTNDNIGISEKRMEELKRITTDMMNSNLSRVDSKLCTLDVVKLMISLEDRKDMTVREKILCSFQIGMNAQRLLGMEEKKT